MSAGLAEMQELAQKPGEWVRGAMPDGNGTSTIETRPIVGIDHALIGVADLERARAAFTRLGFTITPRGRPIGWGTGNYTVMFAKAYRSEERRVGKERVSPCRSRWAP